jgi:PIN domain nuclease of toxin-antitoxin system
MKRYLLDTQAAVWLATINKELPDSLREEIEYVQSLFHVSYMSILEIIHLQKCGKIDLSLSGRELLANFDRMFGWEKGEFLIENLGN